mmetsp:Transcript_25624/g.38169  ORF Transcript_25624/g.38169 Transcript_25624/m.38169 type:complete len:147 (+) Transcript_25624:38-478(+)
MPLKTGMIANNVFNYCENLERVDLVGGIHRTISYLHLERWRDDMNDEINRINQILPHTPATGTIVGGKNEAIKRWIETAYRKRSTTKLSITGCCGRQQFYLNWLFGRPSLKRMTKILLRILLQRSFKSASAAAKGVKYALHLEQTL